MNREDELKTAHDRLNEMMKESRRIWIRWAWVMGLTFALNIGIGIFNIYTKHYWNLGITVSCLILLAWVTCRAWKYTPWSGRRK